MYLKFRQNGKGVKAEHNGLMYLVYPMNYGFAWHIAESEQRPFVRFADGRKHPEDIDCIDTTIQSTLQHMRKLLAEHDIKISWNYRL